LQQSPGINLFTQYYDHQLRFLEHMLRGAYSPHVRIYELYQPTHGSRPTRRGRPRTN